jgi:Protein of unknown function (DUF1353)
MAQFTADVKVVNHLSGRVHQWELCDPMVYRFVDTDESEVVTVPPNFVTDFASVPRPFWFVISPWGRHGRAAIVHDFLYQLGGVTNPGAGTMRRPPKAEADCIFRQAMGVLDGIILRNKRFVHLRLALAWPRRWVMWAAVAVFGHWAYKKEQKKGTAPPLEHEMLEDVVAQVRAEQGQSA